MKALLLFTIALLGISTGANAQVIASGNSTSYFLCSTPGSPKTCGSNNYGQLGDGTTTDRDTLVQVSALTDITAMTAGTWHSLFLKNDGTVWACGYNASGQLGDGTTIHRYTAVQVSGLSGITAIAAGAYHSLFLKNDGTVWACGTNSEGQFGDGTTTDSSTPVQVSALSGITAIAAGGDHSLFLENDGTVWACGENYNGQLGDGTNGVGNISSTPIQVSGLSDIMAIAAGGYHSLFLKNDSSVWACGFNSNGQLGDGTIIERNTAVQVSGLSGSTAIAAGFKHSLFLQNDGSVRACGFNSVGQLGDGTTIDRYTPVLVSGLSGSTAIAAGGGHSLFLKDDDSFWACGYNLRGQLGDGTTINRVSPVQVISGATVTSTNSASICIGENLNISLTSNMDSVTYTWVADDNANTTGESTSAQTTDTINDAIINNTGVSQVVSYTVTPYDCFGAGLAQTVTITVNPLPTVSLILGQDTACMNDGAITLLGSPIDGTFSGVGVNGNSFDPDIAGQGGHTVIYTYTDGNSCSSSASTIITVNPLPTVTLTSLGQNTACIDDGVITLLSSPIDGTFSGDGVNGNSFNPSIAGQGDHSVIYTYTDSNSCSNSALIIITVNPLPNVSLTIGQNTICLNDEAIALLGSPEDGTFSGDGVSGSSFNPSIAGQGDHTVTYTYADGNSCSSSTSTVITVNPLPVVSVTANGNFLTADAISATYQWLNCDNSNLPIENETNQFFIATQNGNYSVIVTQNSCADTSQCMNVNVTGVNNHFSEAGLSVYPNPTNGRVHIDLLSVTGLLRTEIFNNLGELVRSDIRKSVKSFDLQLPDTDGIYFIRLFDADGQVQSAKVLKE